MVAIFGKRKREEPQKKTIVKKVRVEQKPEKEKNNNAQLSKLAYELDLNQRIIKAAELGYQVDKDLSTENHTVFFDPYTKKTVVAYRGTIPTKVDDLLADVDIAKGNRKHQRFADALEVAQRTNKKYGQDNVTLTGHSLGGTQALHASEYFGNNAHVYNPGSSPLFEQGFKRTDNKKIERREDDLVSSGYKNLDITENHQAQRPGLFQSVMNSVFRPFSNFAKSQMNAHVLSNWL
jgi:hypothetical protein